MREKKKTFILPQGKGVGERNSYCKSTNKQLSLSVATRSPCWSAFRWASCSPRAERLLATTLLATMYRETVSRYPSSRVRFLRKRDRDRGPSKFESLLWRAFLTKKGDLILEFEEKQEVCAERSNELRLGVRTGFDRNGLLVVVVTTCRLTRVQNSSHRRGEREEGGEALPSLNLFPFVLLVSLDTA